jgi:hypothetical protein
MDRKKPFAQRRREAAGSYLQGLTELKRFQLPDAPPSVPNNAPFPPGPQGSEEATQKAFRIFEEERQKYLEARERAEFTLKMMMHRKVLQGQIVSMYGRRPIATEELRSMATAALGEGKELDRLMASVREKVAKLPPETTPKMVPIPAAAATAETSSAYLYVGVALGVGAVIDVTLLLLSRRRRAPQEGTSGASQ